MKRNFLLSGLLLLALPVFADIPVTPKPAAVATSTGEFILRPNATLAIDAPAADSLRLADYIAGEWRHFTAAAPVTANISFSIADSIAGVVSPEGYEMNIRPGKISVEATGGAGLFYGLQTLIQLAAASDTIPAMRIVDNPRLAYRGMMLDISRHFRDKDFIKTQIDAVARLKINRVHLHLTDAAGWRLQINKYPELTNFAAWREGKKWKEWNESGNKYLPEGTPSATGGYLTQDDAREIVAYAADRFITVIPEIEMPSHSEEVNATFPELSCTHVQYGQPDLCVGNEKTFEFLENVLDEVLEIFPSADIHIGGDEASKRAWAECELCQKRMTDEGLETVDELQSYLIHRIEQYLNSKGRNLLGWDEIMEGGLAPNATVMSWRGIEGGIRAAESGHRAIMTPGAYCYLDNYQDAPATQPEAIGGYMPLQTVYSYNPVPDSLPEHVKPWIQGVQGNLWCEYIPTAEHAEYMLYPRMIAIAEIGWTPQQLRNWDDFRSRALAVADTMRAHGYNVFDLRTEHGNKPGFDTVEKHLAYGKPVTYNVPWWNRYNAAGTATLTDGLRGGWNYTDGRWQGFLYRGDQRVDVVIDLEESTEIHYVGGEFMQIIGPGAWLPAMVTISISEDGENFTDLAEIVHQQEKTEGLSFKTYSWSGTARARYIRFVANSTEGCQFLDEIVVN